MSKIIDFVKENQLIISPIKYDNKTYIPVKINDETKWYELDYNTSIINYNTKKYAKYNGMMINLYGENRFICFDADSVTANNFMIKFISDNGMNKIFTPSYSNRFGDNKYKNHYYFKLPEDIIFNENKKIQFENHDTFGDLDILYLIAEHKDNILDYKNISEIPVDLLKQFGPVKNINDPQPPTESSNDSDIESKAADLLKLFNPETGDKYMDWFNIGSSLKSIDDTLLFDVFNSFSEKRKKYKNKADVLSYWRTWKDGGGWGTLINIAKKDNIDGFNKWYAKWCKNDLKNKDDDEYKMIKEKFKDRLFMIESPLIYGYINDQNKTIWCDFKDLKQIMKPYQVGKKDFIDLWLQDLSRKTYYNIDFIPNNTDEKIYNNFVGFPYDNNDQIDQSILQPLFTLIDTLFVEQIDRNAFYDFWAWIRQRPHLKTEKAIVMYSDTHGVGKNTLVEFFNKVIHYTTMVRDIKDLIKDFNSHLCNKLVICADEVNAKSKEIRDDLKNMITRTKTICEQKNKAAFEMKDYSNFIFTTNNQDTFYIEPTDRRFILFELADVVMSKDTAKTLYKLMDDDNALKALDTFLKTRTIPDRLEAPMNAYKKRLIAQSLPAYIQMIYRVPERFAPNDPDLPEQERKFSTNDIYDMAVYYAKQHGLQWTFSRDKMNKDFKKEFEQYYKRTETERYYLFPNLSIFIIKLTATRPELITDPNTEQQSQ
jgi:hypothetical protein